MQKFQSNVLLRIEVITCQNCKMGCENYLLSQLLAMYSSVIRDMIWPEYLPCIDNIYSHHEMVTDSMY